MGRRKMTTFAAGAAIAALAWMTLAPAAWHPLAWFSFRAKVAAESSGAGPASVRIPELTTAEERRTLGGKSGPAGVIPDPTVAEVAGKDASPGDRPEPGTVDPAAQQAGGNAEGAGSASELLGSLAFSPPPSEDPGESGGDQGLADARPWGADPEQLLALFGARRADSAAGGFLSRKGDASAVPAPAEPDAAKVAEATPEAPKSGEAPAVAKAEENPPPAPADEPAKGDSPQAEVPMGTPAEELPANPTPTEVAEEEAEASPDGSVEEAAVEPESDPSPMAAVPSSFASVIPREIPTPLQLAQRRLHPPAKPFTGPLVIPAPGRAAATTAANDDQAPADALAAVEPTPEQLTSLEVAAAKAAPAAPGPAPMVAPEPAPADSAQAPAPLAVPESAALPPADVQSPEPTPAPAAPEAEAPEGQPEPSPIRSLFSEMTPAIPEAKAAEDAPKVADEEAPKAETPPTPPAEEPKASEEAPASPPSEPEILEGGLPAPTPAPEAAPKDAPPAAVPLVLPETPKQEQPETPKADQPEAFKEASAPAELPPGDPITPPAVGAEKPAVEPAPAPAGLPPLSGLPTAAEPAPEEKAEGDPGPAQVEAPAPAPGPMPPPEEVAPQAEATGPEADPPGLPEMGDVGSESPLVIKPEDLQGEAAPAPAPEMGELPAPAPLANLGGAEDSPPAPTPNPEPEAAPAPPKADPFAGPPSRPPTRALPPDKKLRNPGHLVDPFSEAVDPFDGTSAPDGAAVTMNMTSLLTKRVAAPIPTVRIMRGQSPAEEEQEAEEPGALPAAEPPGTPPSTGGAPAEPPPALPEPPVLGPPGKKKEGAAPSEFPAELLEKNSPAPEKKGGESDDGFRPAGMADDQPPAAAPAGQPAAVPMETPAAAAPQPAPAVPVPADEAGAGQGIDRLPLRNQDLGLAIEVLSLPVTNLNKPAPFKVIVRNTSKSDIQGVVVRGTLPENFEYTESQPEAERQGQGLTWALGTLAAGAEKSMIVRAIPKATGAFEFGAVATVQLGAKARTQVQEPKLEVKLTATPTQVLKGRPVRFQIEVNNTGTGLARGVTVMARLSPGLKHTLGSNVVQKTIGDLKAGESIKLTPSLDLDTIAAGEQYCELTATSPDIPAVTAAATAKAVVAVVEPQLTLKLVGPDRRFTDTLADYTVLLENPGTAPATNVRVAVTVPTGGTVGSVGAGGRYQEENRRIYWDVPQVEPGKPLDLPFKVRLGGIQIFKLAGQTIADNSLRAQGTLATSVEGIADVDVLIVDKPRILDVGETTEFEVRVVNNGSKDATNVDINAAVSTILEVTGTSGTNAEGTKYNKADGSVKFAPIGRIGPGEKITLKLKARATKAGTASCKVSLVHDDNRNVPIEKSVVATITESSTTRR